MQRTQGQFLWALLHEDTERIPTINPRVSSHFIIDAGCFSLGTDQKFQFLLFLQTTVNIHNCPSSAALSALPISFMGTVMLPLTKLLFLHFSLVVGCLFWLFFVFPFSLISCQIGRSSPCRPRGATLQTGSQVF